MLYCECMDDQIAKDINLDNKEIKSAVSRDAFKQLLPRQRKFLKYYLKTKSRVDAWMLSHKGCKTREGAAVQASVFFKSHPEVADWLYDLAGLGDDEFARVVREGFNAERSQFYLGKQYKDPDHFARLKAVEIGMKLRGKGEGKATGNTMNIQIINDSQQGVFKIVEGEEVA